MKAIYKNMSLPIKLVASALVLAGGWTVAGW